MKIEISEATFNLIGAMLTSDINVPVKTAQGWAEAQAEWAERAAEYNAANPPAEAVEE